MYDAYVINLDRRTDRWESIQKEFSKLLNLCRVSAVDGRTIGITPQQACFMSHQKVIQLAKDKDLPYVIILEDDATVCDPNFETRFRKILEYLETDSAWDIFMGGGTTPFCTQMINIDLGICSVNTYMTHFCVIRQRVYDRILSYKEYKSPIDVYYVYGDYTMYSVYPILSYQRTDSISDIRGVIDKTESQITEVNKIGTEFVNYCRSPEMPDDLYSILESKLSKHKTVSFISYDIFHGGKNFIRNLGTITKRYQERLKCKPALAPFLFYSTLMIVQQFAIEILIKNRQYIQSSGTKTVCIIHGRKQYEQFFTQDIISTGYRPTELWLYSPSLAEEIQVYDPMVKIWIIPEKLKEYINSI